LTFSKGYCEDHASKFVVVPLGKAFN